MKTTHKLALVAALSLASCAQVAEFVMTPDQLASVEAHEAEAAELDVMLPQLDELRQQTQDPEVLAAIDEQEGEILARLAELEGLVNGITADAVRPYQEIAEVAVPDGPWKLPILGLGALATRALTRRGRRHLKKGAKAAGNLAVADAVKSFLAAAGYHSGTAEDAAESFKDAAQREAIQAKSTDSATEDLVRAAVRDAMTAIAEKANDKEQG
jgi:hypothetical protein